MLHKYYVETRLGLSNVCIEGNFLFLPMGGNNGRQRVEGAKDHGDIYWWL